MDTSPRYAPLTTTSYGAVGTVGNLTEPVPARRQQGVGSLRLQLLQIRYDVRDLIRIEPELGHGRMVGNNAFGQAPT